MSKPPNQFDFWYAVNNTDILLLPRNSLETFGATQIHYALLTEPMDAVGQVRIREGRIQAYRPEILTPQSLIETPLEGFQTEEAENFVRWLREHEADLMILKYGFKIRYETLTESVVHDSLQAVGERVLADFQQHNEPMGAVLAGVDDPWEVCLLKLLFEVARKSAPGNMRDLRADPDGSHREIDRAFRVASRDKSKLAPLAELLKAKGRFSEYEDRFYALVRSFSL